MPIQLIVQWNYEGFFNNLLHQCLEKSAWFKKIVGHISTNKVLLYYWKSIFYL